MTICQTPNPIPDTRCAGTDPRITRTRNRRALNKLNARIIATEQFLQDLRRQRAHELSHLEETHLAASLLDKPETRSRRAGTKPEIEPDALDVQFLEDSARVELDLADWREHPADPTAPDPFEMQ
jgi:hypothetical protein